MKKIIALVLALVMTLSLLPMNVWAAEQQAYTDDQVYVVEEEADNMSEEEIAATPEEEAETPSREETEDTENSETVYTSEAVAVSTPLANSVSSTEQAQWGLATGTNNDQAPAAWVDSGTLTEAVTYANNLSSGTAYIQLLSSVRTTSALTFSKNKTTVLDLNGKTINRGLTTATKNGYVISVVGKLTLCDTSATGKGKITGGYHTDSLVAGGVNVKKYATFIMNGGSITRNQNSYSYGGGVYNGGTFIMNGGSITGNRAYRNNGYGYGGGVYNNGTFTMTGGSIVGNTSTGAGSGVYLADDSIMKISGTPVISGNVKNGTLNSTIGFYENGSKNNLYNNVNNDPVTIVGELNENASIGVANTLNDGEPSRAIASGSEYTITKSDAAKFLCDKENDYIVILDKTYNEVIIKPILSSSTTALSLSCSDLVLVDSDVTLTLNVSSSKVTVLDTTLEYDATKLELLSCSSLLDGWKAELDGTKLTMTGTGNPVKSSTDLLSMTFHVKSSTAVGTALNVSFKDIIAFDGKNYSHVRDASWRDVVSPPPVAQWGLAVEGSRNQTPTEWVGEGSVEEAMTYANGLASGVAYIQLFADVNTTGVLEFANKKTTILDLNGNNINRGLTTATANGNVITVKGNLTLCDTNWVDGKISGGYNTGKGGGVYVMPEGSFTMRGGIISGNSSSSAGGGVYVDGRFTVAGIPVISDNWSGTGTSLYKSNVYLPNRRNITVDEWGLSYGTSIGVSMESGTGLFADRANYVYFENEYFFSDSGEYIVDMDDDYFVLVRCPQARWGVATGPNDDQKPTKWEGSGSLNEAISFANGGHGLLFADVIYVQILKDIGDAAPIRIYKGHNVILDLNGKTLRRDLTGDFVTNGYTDGYIIKVEGNLTICDSNKALTGTITGGNNYDYGGGIYVAGGAVIMQNGIISGNKAYRGGGVYVDGYGSFTMNGGSITNNRARMEGSGVTVSSGSFRMNGGTISNNANGRSGVYLSAGAHFTLNDGTISGNTADTGGGVCVAGSMGASASFTMTGGTISENTAGTGGGVYVYKYGVFSMSGGTITGNTAGTAGGVYFYGETLKVSGAPVISNNKAGTGDSLQVSNLFLTEDKKVTVETLTDGASIGVRLSTGEGWLAIGGAAYVDSNYFISDVAAYKVVADGNNLDLVAPEVQWGLATGESNEKAPTSWSDGTLTQAMTYANSLPSGTAYIQLLKDIAISEPLVFAEGKTTILDLHGRNIDRGLEYTPTSSGNATYLDGNVITVKGNLTLCDSSASGNGKVTGGNYDKGGGVYIESGVFTLESGSISENAASYGGGVYVNRGSFIMNGGTISENIAHWDGGGVYIGFNGIFTLNGGTISNNTAKEATYGGGGVIVHGTFIMNDGSISENTAKKDGGGVYVYFDANFTMNDGSISGNTAAYGGGVEVVTDATFTMRGGTISGNNATDPTNKYACRGGGVYVYYGTFEMSGGEIKGNNHDSGSGGGSGGGVCFESGTVLVSGTPVISGNVKNGTLNSTTGLYESGTNGSISDVSLFNSNTITIVDALKDGASIGVVVGNVSVRVVAYGSKNPAYTLTASDAAKFTSNNGYYSVLDSTNNRVKLTQNAGSDVTISGTITSYLDASADVTVELFANGSIEADYVATVKGNSSTYSIEGVAAGTYTMKVSKANHVTREYTVVVTDTDVTQDAKIHPKGDVDGNGTVTTMDFMRVNSHARSVTLLTGYALACADVVGTDGAVTTMDAMRINAHAKETNMLW